MSVSHIEDSEHWRQRAVEMRALAEGVVDARSAAVMLRIAAEYEKLAARAMPRSDAGKH